MVTPRDQRSVGYDAVSGAVSISGLRYGSAPAPARSSAADAIMPSGASTGSTPAADPKSTSL